MSALRLLISIICISAALAAASKKNSEKTKKAIPKNDEFKEIIDSYLFINDFYVKSETRQNSDELFWRYPFKLPKATFPIFFDQDYLEKEIPKTDGIGREYEHINMGRGYYLQGNYEEAKKVWLSGRQNFGKNYAHHRRNDYFIAMAFIKIAEEKLKTEPEGFLAVPVRTNLANAATFLSWAFVVKKDIPDPLLDDLAPRQLYNLASIYFRYERFAAAYGAADEGLNYLRRTGRKDYRSPMRRILAEAHIQNGTYLNAVQELDVALRQDPDPEQAAAIFARVGDIYFGLNNFELAEESYATANRLDQKNEVINSTHFVLRGEALFWLGQFSEAQKNFYYALTSFAEKHNRNPLSDELSLVAQMRIADCFLALKKFDKAQLEYFRVMQEFRGTQLAQLAKIRGACLELPAFDGNNVKHARKLLSEVKTDVTLPADAIELAWACDVASYTQRERTENMVERVREFSNKYPHSRFLDNLLEPVKEVRAEKLAEYFAEGKIYSALRFFEQRRKTLFPKIDKNLSIQLFEAYIDVDRIAEAQEFWSTYQNSPESDLKKMRAAAFLAETTEKNPKSNWAKQSQDYAKRLSKHRWTIEPNKLSLNYFNRVRELQSAIAHYPWTYQLARSWGQKDTARICTQVYPLLTAQLKTLPVNESYSLRKDLTEYIAQLLPALLKSDETCAITLLQLEIESFRHDPRELAGRYLARQSWPWGRHLTSIVFEVAELNANSGNLEGARQLWKLIREKGPSDAPEQTFAKVRLDSSRTVYDGIWR